MNYEFESVPETCGPQMVPHSREAEEALLGAIMINPSAYDDVVPIIEDKSYFYIHRNQWVWEVFGRLIDKGEPIDFILVTEELDKMGRLADIGGAAYITRLMNNVPSSLHAVSYAKRVADTWERREGLADAQAYVIDCYDEENDFNEAKLKFASKLAKSRIKGKGAVHIDNWLQDGYDYLEERSKNPREHAGISTGLGELDRTFGDGLLPGANLLIGEPGLGKTMLAQQITVNIAEDKIPIAFYSAEMFWRDMYLRFMSGQAKQKVSEMRKGNIDFNKITKAMEIMSKYPLWVDDPKGMTTTELRADLIRLKSEHGIKVVVFDYMGKLVDYLGKMEKWKRSEWLMARVQDILVELDIAGLIIHQVTKDGFDKADMSGVAGGVDVTYEIVCAVQIMEGDEDNIRKVVNVKPPRGVEGYWKMCKLYKDPLHPIFGLVEEEDKFVPHYMDDR